MGFADAGEMWRSGYDMSPAELAAETDRLWGQVKPLYEQLHCYTRDKLMQAYGKDKGQVAGGLLPAHLMGNMWQQDWGNLWDMLEPYPGAGSLDITAALEKQYQTNNLGASAPSVATCNASEAGARFEGPARGAAGDRQGR
jgi:peptidyl-dipeptidase A